MSEANRACFKPSLVNKARRKVDITTHPQPTPTTTPEMPIKSALSKKSNPNPSEPINTSSIEQFNARLKILV
jgi:hypothetical protein